MRYTAVRAREVSLCGMGSKSDSLDASERAGRGTGCGVAAEVIWRAVCASSCRYHSHYDMVWGGWLGWLHGGASRSYVCRLRFGVAVTSRNERGPRATWSTTAHCVSSPERQTHTFCIVHMCELANNQAHELLLHPPRPDA